MPVFVWRQNRSDLLYGVQVSSPSNNCWKMHGYIKSSQTMNSHGFHPGEGEGSSIWTLPHEAGCKYIKASAGITHQSASLTIYVL